MLFQMPLRHTQHNKVVLGGIIIFLKLKKSLRDLNLEVFLKHLEKYFV